MALIWDIFTHGWIAIDSRWLIRVRRITGSAPTYEYSSTRFDVHTCVYKPRLGHILYNTSCRPHKQVDPTQVCFSAAAQKSLAAIDVKVCRPESVPCIVCSAERHSGATRRKIRCAWEICGSGKSDAGGGTITFFFSDGVCPYYWKCDTAPGSCFFGKPPNTAAIDLHCFSSL